MHGQANNRPRQDQRRNVPQRLAFSSERGAAQTGQERQTSKNWHEVPLRSTFFVRSKRFLGTPRATNSRRVPTKVPEKTMTGAVSSWGFSPAGSPFKFRMPFFKFLVAMVQRWPANPQDRTNAAAVIWRSVLLLVGTPRRRLSPMHPGNCWSSGRRSSSKGASILPTCSGRN